MTHPHVRITARPGVSLILSLVLAFISLAGSMNAQQPTRTVKRATPPVTSPSAAQTMGGIRARPRLVLVIVVDQFRADYLERFGDLFAANGGLRRLMQGGAQWTNANFDHMPTYTAPGHATIMTGAV